MDLFDGSPPLLGLMTARREAKCIDPKRKPRFQIMAIAIKNMK